MKISCQLSFPALDLGINGESILIKAAQAQDLHLLRSKLCHAVSTKAVPITMTSDGRDHKTSALIYALVDIL